MMITTWPLIKLISWGAVEAEMLHLKTMKPCVICVIKSASPHSWYQIFCNSGILQNKSCQLMSSSVYRDRIRPDAVNYVFLPLFCQGKEVGIKQLPLVHTKNITKWRTTCKNSTSHRSNVNSSRTNMMDRQVVSFPHMKHITLLI